jgi:hypothetical protein
VYCSLGTHIEGLCRVIGSVCDGERRLWCPKTVLSYWGSSKGDLLEVGYVIFLRVGALESAVVQRGNEFLPGTQCEKEDKLQEQESDGCHLDGSLEIVSRLNRLRNV